MHPYDAAQAEKALRITSVIRCDVKTLPPTTAAYADGFKKQPGGTFTSIG